MSRSIRSRSFSRCKRAISAAWSADGSVACVVGRRAAAVGSRPAPRNPPSAATPNRVGQVPGHRPDRATARSHQIERLPLVVVRKRPTLTSFHPTPPGFLEPTTGVHQFGGGSSVRSSIGRALAHLRCTASHTCKRFAILPNAPASGGITFGGHLAMFAFGGRGFSQRQASPSMAASSRP